MLKNTPEGREMINSIAYDVVYQEAPEELDLFDELMMDYFAKPLLGTNDRSRRDDPLGFGFEGMFVATTPAVAAMVTAAITYIVQEVIKAAQEESAKALTAKISAFFQPQKAGSSLDPDHFRRIFEIANSDAIAAGLPVEEAKRMAHALIGKLAVSS